MPASKQTERCDCSLIKTQLQMNSDRTDLMADYRPEFMEMAMRLAEENIDRDGGPFGAVIVRDGEVISTGANSVTIDNDPTAHAEVMAIRAACRSLSSFKLPGCVVYSSCEPCPMCLSALYWAGVSKIFYANTREEAAAIDFDDKMIYDEIGLDPIRRRVPGVHVYEAGAIRAFEKWAANSSKTEY